MHRISDKIKTLTVYSLIIFGILGLLSAPEDVISSAKEGFLLCQNIIIPSLFPFFVFSALAVDTGLFDRASGYLSPLMRIFNINASGAPALVLGICAGYPIGAKTAISLYKNKMCSKQDAERLLTFSNNPGPAFVLSAIGAGIFGNPAVGIMLYIAQIIASIITGIVFGHIWHSKGEQFDYIRTTRKKAPLTASFVSAIKESAVSILFICAFVLFFYIFIKLLCVFKIIPLISGFLAVVFSSFGFNTTFFENLMYGFFEITTGVRATGLTATSSLLQKLTLTGIILGWSGLSVHCQVLFFLQNSGLSKKSYFYGKIFQSVISGIITYILALSIPFVKTVFSSTSANLQNIASSSFAVILMLSVALIFILTGLCCFCMCLKEKKIVHKQLDKIQQ